MSSRSTLLPPFLWLSLLVGCSAGSIAKATRTDAPKPASVLGDKQPCVLPAGVSEPWVVDMQADRRIALEAALRGPPILVAYNCKELVLLPHCGVEGRYEYAGTTIVEDQLDLQDADAVTANLSGGSTLAFQLKAQMERGIHLKIGYVVVGQQSTTLARLSRKALPEQCRAATHFIARATVGAYVVEQSSSAAMGGVADLFERGAKAESKSSDVRSAVVGDRRACAASSTSDEAPLAKCAAPLKIMLLRIADDESPAKLLDSSGKRAGAGVCRIEEIPGCTKRCSGGDAASCAMLGFMYEEGKGVPIDGEQALGFYERACEAGDPDGCAGLGFLYGRGVGVKVDKDRAERLLSAA